MHHGLWSANANIFFPAPSAPIEKNGGQTPPPPRAPRTQGDEPTDTLQGRGGMPRTPPYPQLRGRVRRGTSPGPEPLD